MTETRPTDRFEAEDRVRAWAKGMYPTEAGVELLIRQGKAIYPGAPWLEDGGELTRVNVDSLLDRSGAWSGGERRITRIAASLLGGPEVNLSEEIPGLGRESLRLVLAAIAHANGSHEASVAVLDEGGAFPRFERPGSLFPWPEVQGND